VRGGGSWNQTAKDAALRQLSTLPPVESFWGTLKTELVPHRRYATHAEAAREIAEYIDLFYNGSGGKCGWDIYHRWPTPNSSLKSSTERLKN
jgi:hypothetical protein